MISCVKVPTEVNCTLPPILLRDPELGGHRWRYWSPDRLRVSHHDGGDDGDERVAVGQQPVGGLRASLPVGRGHAARARGGGAAPRALLLHLLLDVVLDDLAVGGVRHRGRRGGGGGGGGDPRSRRTVCKQTRQLTRGAGQPEAAAGLISGFQQRSLVWERRTTRRFKTWSVFLSPFLWWILLFFLLYFTSMLILCCVFKKGLWIHLLNGW